MVKVDGESQVRSAGDYVEFVDHEHLFVPHKFPEHIIDLGEVRINYGVAGSPSNPALLLIPGQTESWWGYEAAMSLLSESYQVYAVDLRGQGRSTWTPGRYSLDLFGNDLVRFIDRAIGRSVVVCGLSSGGVIAAWLSAFAAPGQILAAVYEDPPLFASEISPAVGHSIRQTFAYHLFRMWDKWIGPQWSVDNVNGLMEALQHDMPPWLPKAMAMVKSAGKIPIDLGAPPRVYDPEWANVFYTGRGALTCDHDAMLKHVKVPILFTHHFRYIDPESGNLIGASSDLQVQHVRRLVEGAGNSFTLLSFPDHAHSMHGTDPVTYVKVVTEWLANLDLGSALHP